tara:strand:- start:1479 stop:2906 length:1428 start_codon:yes stop_codon:yes gene_type:complete
MTYKGYIDFLSPQIVRGWAAKLTGSAFENVMLTALFDNGQTQSISANHYRPDLEKNGIGSGSFSFEVQASPNSGLDFTAATILYPDETPVPLTESAKKNLTNSQWPQLDEGILKNIPNLEEIASLNHSARLAHLVWYQWPNSLDTTNSLKKICIYVTYNEYPLIKESHKVQVEALQEIGYFVISVVASNHAPDDGSKLSLGDLTIVKKNVGYDFGSWWVGYKTIANLLGHRIYEVEKFAFCNDSYLGAISSDEIRALEERPEWLVGLTNSPQRGTHVQSYFSIAQHDYVKTGKFNEFISNYSFPKNKDDVIKYGELLLSHGDNVSTYAKHDYNHLVYLWVSQIREMAQEEYHAKIRFGLYASLEEIEKDFEVFFSKIRHGDVINPTHAFWRQIVQSGSSILKTELLIKNPINIPNWYSVMAHCIDNPTLARSLSEIQKNSAKPKDQNTAILLGLLEMASTTKRNQKERIKNASKD